eukprot:scaffold1254_cov251-Pinguiococcus_pyrenoidosus.AAC.24
MPKVSDEEIHLMRVSTGYQRMLLTGFLRRTWAAGLLACWPAGLLACWPVVAHPFGGGDMGSVGCLRSGGSF